MIPKDERALAKVTGLPPVAKAVLLALVSFTDNKGRCFPSRAMIGARAGLSPRSVSTGLAWLADPAHGPMITREEQRRSDGGRSSDLYVVASPTAAKAREEAERVTRKLPLMTVMRPTPEPVESMGITTPPPLHELQGPPLQELQGSKESILKDIDSNSGEARRRRAEVAPLLADLAASLKRTG